MKGSAFIKPLELSININGESWYQQDQISGNLSVKNHGAEQADLSQYGIFLAEGDARKIKKKADGAFVIKEKVIFEKSLDAGSETNIDFAFQLKTDSMITDKNNSYYIVYGNEDNQDNFLKLDIKPLPLYGKFIEIFDLFFRFKLREAKSNKKGQVDFKLIPPEGGEFKTFEQLNLIMKLEEKVLKTEWNFKITSLGMVDGEMKKTSRKDKRTLDIPLSEIMMFGDSLDQDKVQKKITEILSDVKNKLMF